MYVCTHGYDFLEQKDTKHTGKRKRYKKRSPGEIRHRCAEVLFRQGCTQHTSQQWVLTEGVKCCQPGKLIRDFVPRAFTWELASPKCNLQTPRRKAGVQQKPYYLHNEFRHSDWHHLGDETLPHPSSQMPVRGQLCNQSYFQQTSKSFNVHLI